MDYKQRIIDARFERETQSNSNPILWAINIALLVLAVFLNGFVIQQYWAWFIVPLGVVALTLPHAIGIAWFIPAIVGTRRDESLKEGDKALAKILFVILSNLVYLAAGYVISLFM